MGAALASSLSGPSAAAPAPKKKGKKEDVETKEEEAPPPRTGPVYVPPLPPSFPAFRRDRDDVPALWPLDLFIHCKNYILGSAARAHAVPA